MISTIQPLVSTDHPVTPELRDASLKAAESIAHHVCKEAIWHKSMCTWIGMKHDFKSGVEPELISATIDSGMYNGTSGIACFLMNLDKIIDQPILKYHVEGAINYALYHMNKIPDSMKHSYWSGQLGIAMTALEAGQYYKNEVLEEKATSTLKELFRSEILGDSGLDVLDGSAGAILSCMKHTCMIPGSLLPHLINYITRHTDRILAKSRLNEKGRFWPSIHDDQPLLGYAHGTSGYAHALMEAGYYLNNNHYIQAATEAIEYENHFYNSEHNNWPDFRKQPGSTSEVKFMNAWCHGAMGIGLSRLRCYELTRRNSYLSDAKKCLQHACLPHGVHYTLSCQCHGFSGNAELLMYAYQITGDNQFKNDLNDVIHKTLDHHLSGKAWINGLNTHHQIPGLMDGMAGVGYFFLRAYDGLKTSSILI